MWQVDYDPEGLFGALPSIVTCLCSVLVGKIFRQPQKIEFLFFTAFGLLVSGYLFSIWFPINKAIWSSSFVLVTGRWATVILAVIYYLKDIKQFNFATVFK
jgi:predicted acyltransferase